MKLPYLDFLDNTLVVINITDGINDNGAPNIVLTYTGNCNFEEHTNTIRDTDGQLVTLIGSLMIGEDIAPNIPVLTGNVTINGQTWNIYNSARPRNPDGTVHHTELRLI